MEDILEFIINHTDAEFESKIQKCFRENSYINFDKVEIRLKQIEELKADAWNFTSMLPDDQYAIDFDLALNPIKDRLTRMLRCKTTYRIVAFGSEFVEQPVKFEKILKELFEEAKLNLVNLYGKDWIEHYLKIGGKAPFYNLSK